jgi:hypothetical protein
MSHDKIKSAARRRMAETGESYAAARRKVTREFQAVVACGAGRAIATGAPPAQIACALEQLLADAAVLREARRFAGVIAGLGGGDVATREVAGPARWRAPAGPGQS